jgi:predicted nucleotidyltransferase
MLRLNSVSKEFVKIAKKRLGKKLLLLILYGSVAKSKAKKDSDIDIFAVVANKESREVLFDIASEYLRKGILISIIAETPNEFRKLKNFPFTRTVLSEGEILYGKVR